MNLIKTRATLAEAQNFDGDFIVYKFMESYDVSLKEGRELFEETKKWLWFASNYNKPVIDKSMLMIDCMWHTFILFTKPYAAYCHQKFGKFLHHSPTRKEEKDKYKAERKNDPKKVLDEAYIRFKAQYEAIYDSLGPETLIKWYKVFPEKYSVERINQLRKSI